MMAADEILQLRTENKRLRAERLVLANLASAQHLMSDDELLAAMEIRDRAIEEAETK